ncbi:putative quinol monooxygenase [Nocardioides lentus]|uniref:Quinol monooxygenase n=1 Tax=Nocardioides lentus TaxID=338077 RepID=A0ABN2PAQ9_9ACTN
MIVITVKKKLKPGAAEDYLAASRPFLEATRAEPGNLWFEHYRSVEDPDTVLTIEAFADKAAGEAHVAAPHFQDSLTDDTTKQYVAEVPEILYVDVPDKDGWDRMAEF